MEDSKANAVRQSMRHEASTISLLQTTDCAQGYELTEEECNLSLDEFRDMCADGNGAPRYDLSPSQGTSPLWLTPSAARTNAVSLPDLPNR